MRDIFSEHRGFWNPAHTRSLYLAFVLLFLAIVIQVTAGRYSSHHALDAHYANDLFLDNLPTVNLDFLIVQGAIVFWAFALGLLAVRPRYLIFGLKTIALFVIARAFFINLTYVGIYPNHAVFDTTDVGYAFYKLFTFQGNFFFSGHTAFPYLMALIFWPEKKWRRFFAAMAFIFGLSVLLAHVHYSIDVFAAPFITYGTFKVAEQLFASDFSLIPVSVRRRGAEKSAPRPLIDKSG